MAVLDTGWVYVLDNAETEIVVPTGRVISARVRWKGAQRTETTYSNTSANDSGAGGTDFYAPLTPAVGDGTLDRVTVSVSMSISPSANWLVSARAGGTLYGGVVNENSGTGSGGSVSATDYAPSSRSGSGSGVIPYSDATITAWSVTVTARWRQTTTYQTQNPQITVAGDVTGHTGTLNNGVESDWYPALGFVAGQSNTVRHDSSSSGRAYVQIEITYTEPMTATLLEPGHLTRTVRDDLVFCVAPVMPDGNEAEAWFPRIVIAQGDSVAVPLFDWDSSSDQTDWEYFDALADEWVALTGDGAPVDAECRFTPPVEDMPIGRWAWAAKALDDDIGEWGALSAVWLFRLVLTVQARFALEIAGTDFSGQARAIRVSETTNGELGSMGFEVYAPDEQVPEDGNEVALAVRDATGAEEQFNGWMEGDAERVAPQIYRCRVRLPDSILAQRYVREDYGSQDVGQTLADIVDDYCSPLDSSGIDTATGFVRPVAAFGRTALDVAKELREQYGLMFWVRSTDYKVFLVKPEDQEAALLAVARGQVG